MGKPRRDNHQFLLMWCCEGLEYIGDITADSQAAVWSSLQGKKHQSQIPNLLHLELRARYNSQRFYEIYIIEATQGITEDDIREMFERDPQGSADLIRARGTRIFGEPRGQQKSVIQ